jgi:hypothetical protein
MVRRKGASSLGCLIPLLVLALAAYFAMDFTMAYFRFYQFKDTMGSEARFASDFTDDQITKHLAALADSLELPPEAGTITITRGTTTITISSDYDVVVKLPLKKERVLHFHPSVESKL